MLTTDIYNAYLKGDNYESTIAFITTNKIVVHRDLFFLKFKNDNFKNGIYSDFNNYLQKLNYSKRISNFVDDKYISDIVYARKYFSYIKILEDKNNTQLEGQIMIFSYGTLIFNMLKDEISNNNYKSVDNSFRLVRFLKQQFPSYEHSRFNCDNYNYSDYSLDLESKIKYNVFNPLIFERKEKLLKLSEVK